ncbi:lantibiotic dehydratase [Ferruginibacter sp. SUN106]|uniref:lantibiotic dehydratase n=1 Tax=Ferruginibacter sp. SUN106 TaxID=2978348 RepID=UPI003D36851B
MPIPYTYHPKLVMRTPQNSLRTSVGTENDFLQQLLKDKNFLEALFLASPVLHEELLKYAQGAMSDTKGIKKLIFSLAKYHLRMSSRCTPFGLFSGCAVTAWDDNETSIIIDTENKLDRHTRFDMHYLCALAQHIAALPFIKSKLLYYPNSAFYKMAEEIRYVEYHYRNGRRKHIISAVLASDYTLDILQAAADGITVQNMINRLVGEDITQEEAAEFIDEIIAAQLVVSEMEPSVTGSEFLYQIISVLKKINTASETAINEITGMLEQINALIKCIDTNSINDSTAYTEITDCLKKLNLPFELNKLFQCDLNIKLTANKINSSIKTELAEALNIINLTNKTIANPNLTAFASRFYERYEDAELPLLEVLDNETGIGYADQHTGNITPLLDGMAIAGTPGDSKFEWSVRDKFLFGKLLSATETRQNVIEFQEPDFKDFKNGWDSLPPSLSVIFRLLDDDRILLENSGSSSAANLLARFAHGNKDIHAIIDDVVKDEDEKNPSVIFAEIVHLPESRIGNILLHPSFRKYEIPFLSKSAVTADCQIALGDLMVSVKANTVFLRSKKLNKIIIPRLSSAHNYSFGALPIYQFLADLQLQGKQAGILFNWGILENQFKQLPRAVYKNVVLKEAQWNFVKKDIEMLLNKQDNDFTIAINQFKETWRLPSLIVLADGDNELLINLHDKLMVDVWLEAVKNRGSFIIKEFLGGTKSSAVKDSTGNLYANQFIAVLMRNTAAYNFPEPQKEMLLITDTQKNFTLGTEWVYYKLYCGHKTADTVLQSVIQPLVQQLTANNIIDSFFFIRYNDPHFHLRVRFHITTIENLGILLKQVQQHLEPFLQQRLIWNIQNDTYKREINRYGHQTITEAEKLFFHDSLAVLKFLDQTEGDNREQLRWQWTFRAIDEWLNAFNYTTAQKMALLELLKTSYHTEFNSNKFLKEFLGNKYRAHKTAIEQIMNTAIDETHPLFSLVKILKEKTVAMRPVLMTMLEKEKTKNASPALSETMASYIHMLVNRIVTSSPREHELVIYDLLHCFYKSRVAREKAADKNIVALKMAV